MGIWDIGIPKDTLIELISKMDADGDGFVRVGEVRKFLKDYAKQAKKSYKEKLIRARK